MKVKVTDNTIFQQLEMHIVAENLDEIWGLLTTLNVSTISRLEHFPDYSGMNTAEKEVAVRSIEMQLWNPVSPVYDKFEKAYNEANLL